MTDIQQYSERTFEQIRQVDEYGNEYWYARELMEVIGYKQWRRFADIIAKAIEACKNSGFSASEHFAFSVKSLDMPHGGVRQLDNYKLTRYACYLIVQNASPRLKHIANKTHYNIGLTVRNTMLELSGTAPEELPSPTESIKALEKRQRLMVKKLKKQSRGGED